MSKKPPAGPSYYQVQRERSKLFDLLANLVSEYTNPSPDWVMRKLRLKDAERYLFELRFPGQSLPESLRR